MILAIVLGAVLPAAGQGATGPTRSDRLAIVVGQQQTYQSVAVSLRNADELAHTPAVVVDLPANAGTAEHARAAATLVASRPDLIVAVGSPATQIALDSMPDVPVVFVMVPNALDAPFLTEDAHRKARLAGLAADVAPKHCLDWIKSLHPRASRIGVLHSSRTRKTVMALQQAGLASGLSVCPIDTDRDRFVEAIEQLNRQRCDGVLMIPDAGVYNASNVRRLLLWGLRQKKPVWAFSESVVKAGAFAGQYAEAEEVGREAAEVVRRVLDGADPQTIGLRYPKSVQAAVNERTAEMIGLPLKGKQLGPNTKRYGGEP